MRNGCRILTSAILTSIVLSAGVASAQATFGTQAEARCAAEKYKAWSKYSSCFDKALGKFYSRAYDGGTGIKPPTLGKCLDKYAGAWARIQQIGVSPCSGERFADNGDGTVTDKLTGMQWEQKTDDGSIHDRDNDYTFSGAFSDFLATLRSTSFAGQNDWRVPGLKEFYSIVEGSAGDIDPIFGDTTGLTKLEGVITEPLFNDTSNWIVTYGTNDLGINDAPKEVGETHRRAVRGGL